MRCSIICHTTSYSHLPNSYGAETNVVTVCETHKWTFPEGQPTGAGDFCPIGRIEQATEEALEKIAAAKA